ncbi:unnamed protein product, partial [Ixodes pacificus]
MRATGTRPCTSASTSMEMEIDTMMVTCLSQSSLQETTTGQCLVEGMLRGQSAVAMRT